MNSVKRFVVYIVAVYSLLITPSLFASELGIALDSIKQKGVLRIAVLSYNVSPFVMHHEEGASGFDIDMANDIAEKLGVAVSFVYADNVNSVLELLTQGKADMAISKITMNLERRNSVAFTTPYFSSPLEVVVRRLDAPGIILDFADLLKIKDHFRLGIVANTSFCGVAEQLIAEHHETTTIETVMFKSESEIFKMLQDNSADIIDGALVDGSYVQYWLDHTPKANIPLKRIPVITRYGRALQDNLAIAVDMEHIQLLDWLNMYIYLKQQDGWMDNLYNKYFK